MGILNIMRANGIKEGHRPVSGCRSGGCSSSGSGGGTKAAAATAGVVRYKNGAPKSISHQVVKADRPFLFMIQHVATGTCLFLGRVTDPAPDMAATAGGLPSRGPAKK
jgi:hypothetical protein